MNYFGFTTVEVFDTENKFITNFFFQNEAVPHLQVYFRIKSSFFKNFNCEVPLFYGSLYEFSLLS